MIALIARGDKNASRIPDRPVHPQDAPVHLKKKGTPTMAAFSSASPSCCPPCSGPIPPTLLWSLSAPRSPLRHRLCDDYIKVVKRRSLA